MLSIEVSMYGWAARGDTRVRRRRAALTPGKSGRDAGWHPGTGHTQRRSKWWSLQNFNPRPADQGTLTFNATLALRAELIDLQLETHFGAGDHGHEDIAENARGRSSGGIESISNASSCSSTSQVTWLVSRAGAPGHAPVRSYRRTAHQQLGFSHRTAGSLAARFKGSLDGKNTLFEGLLGPLFRAWGGIPVNR